MLTQTGNIRRPPTGGDITAFGTADEYGSFSDRLGSFDYSGADAATEALLSRIDGIIGGASSLALNTTVEVQSGNPQLN